MLTTPSLEPPRFQAQGCGYLFRRMQGVPTGIAPAPPAANYVKPPSKRVMVNEQELLRDFIAESYNKLTQVRNGLAQLATLGEPQEPFSSLFWALHSIRDGAGVLGLTEIRRLAHAMEKALVALAGQGQWQTLPLHHPLLAAMQEGLGLLDFKLSSRLGRLQEEPRPTEVAEVGSLVRQLKTVLADFAPTGEESTFYWRVMAGSKTD